MTPAGPAAAHSSPPPGGPGPSLGGALWQSLWPVLIGIAVAIAIHLALPRLVNVFWVKIAMQVGLAMIFAVSLNVVNGMTGQFSIGHAGFIAIGGYTAGAITYYGSLLLWKDTIRHGGFLGAGEWLFCGACLAGGLVAAGLGYLVGLPSLRLRGDYLAIVTLGFGEIVRVLLQQTNQTLGTWSALESATRAELFPPPVGGALGFGGIPKYLTLFWVYSWLAVTVIAAWRLKNSSLGRAMISVREDEIAARAMGVNVTRQKVWAFILAAFFAGCGGGLYAHETGYIEPKDAGFQRSFEYVIMVVLGGSGSISGSMIAAAVLTWLPEALRNLEAYRLIVYSLLLVVMMLVRPQGLLGFREVWELPWIAALKARLFGGGKGGAPKAGEPE